MLQASFSHFFYTKLTFLTARNRFLGLKIAFFTQSLLQYLLNKKSCETAISWYLLNTGESFQCSLEQTVDSEIDDPSVTA